MRVLKHPAILDPMAGVSVRCSREEASSTRGLRSENPNLQHSQSQSEITTTINSSRNCLHRTRSRYSAVVSREPMANLFESPRYIAVEGPIRVGKEHARAHSWRPSQCAARNRAGGQSFSAIVLRGGSRRRFPGTTSLSWSGVSNNCARSISGRDSQKTVIADFIFEKDKLFACLNLNDQELETYNRYYNFFREQLPTPDLVIYLQATPEVLKKRLKKKNAPSEKAINDDYLEEVIKAYEHFFFHYTSSDLLIVNTSEIDFVDHNEDLKELLRKVTEPIKGTQYFLPLGSQEAASA